MEKKSLKSALDVQAMDNFVQQGAPTPPQLATEEVDSSTSRQIPRSPKRRVAKALKPSKVTFYWDPGTEDAMEQLRLQLRRKYGKKLSRSEVSEGLIKLALKNENAVQEIM